MDQNMDISALERKFPEKWFVKNGSVANTDLKKTIPAHDKHLHGPAHLVCWELGEIKTTSELSKKLESGGVFNCGKCFRLFQSQKAFTAHQKIAHMQVKWAGEKRKAAEVSENFADIYKTAKSYRKQNIEGIMDQTIPRM